MKFMVAFASPKRSRKIINLATVHAKAMNAEIVLVRVMADPFQVGIVAELIATDTPKETAERQIEQVVEELKSQGLSASGLLKIGPVADTLVATTNELQVDAVYIGSSPIKSRGLNLSMQDPILHYMVSRCPVPLVIARDTEEEDTD